MTMLRVIAGEFLNNEIVNKYTDLNSRRFLERFLSNKDINLFEVTFFLAKDSYLFLRIERDIFNEIKMVITPSIIEGDYEHMNTCVCALNEIMSFLKKINNMI